MFSPHKQSLQTVAFLFKLVTYIYMAVKYGALNNSKNSDDIQSRAIRYYLGVHWIAPIPALR